MPKNTLSHIKQVLRGIEKPELENLLLWLFREIDFGGCKINFTGKELHELELTTDRTFHSLCFQVDDLLQKTSQEEK